MLGGGNKCQVSKHQKKLADKWQIFEGFSYPLPSRRRKFATKCTQKNICWREYWIILWCHYIKCEFFIIDLIGPWQRVFDDKKNTKKLSSLSFHHIFSLRYLHLPPPALVLGASLRRSSFIIDDPNQTNKLFIASTTCDLGPSVIKSTQAPFKHSLSTLSNL